MKTFRQVDAAEFAALELHAHRLLADVPLHDAWRVSLPGGGPGRTLADVRESMRFDALAEVNPVVRLLFGLRSALGRLFGLDAAPSAPVATEHSDRVRVPDALRDASEVEPGSQEGPFRVLYALADEGVSEIRNATVHAFLVLALRPAPDGYLLYWAVYVAPVGAITRFYMALIDPFRRLLVYPAILRHVRRRWIETHAQPAPA